VDNPGPLFTDGLPNLREDAFRAPTLSEVAPMRAFAHRPRFLLLYGSLRERSYSPAC
jgi:arsenical resistance protein ArsH